LKHREIHRYKNCADNDPKKNNDKRFEQAANGISPVFDLLGILNSNLFKKIIQPVHFLPDPDQLDKLGRVKIKS
jgi:hypothetical protein